MTSSSVRITAAILAASAGLALASCAASDGSNYYAIEADLSAAVRRERATAIRDAARARGINDGALMVAMLAEEETHLAHCSGEFPACPGPASPDCGGRPVLSGGGDGPCSLNQGGLGMFQIDDGTEDDTVRAHGERVLTMAGNADVAIDRILDKMVRSSYLGISSQAEAITFLNNLRIDDANFDSYIRTIIRYWNGCRETAGCWSNRYTNYNAAPRTLLAEFGHEFWYGTPADAGMRDAAMARDAAMPPRDAFVAPRDAFVALRDSGRDAFVAPRDAFVAPRDAFRVPRDTGGGCRSSILGRTVMDGECVQMPPDQHECSGTGCGWYQCAYGTWTCAEAAACTGAMHDNAACGTSGTSCYSNLLSVEVQHGACVQMDIAACGVPACGWYRCVDGSWSCTDPSSCAGDRFQHADCTDCGQVSEPCSLNATGRSACCPAFDCQPRTWGQQARTCCLQGNLDCTSSAQCCGTMQCVEGRCQCHNTGMPCAGDLDCCSGLWCTNGVCGSE